MSATLDQLGDRIVHGGRLAADEALWLYRTAPTAWLGRTADAVRARKRALPAPQRAQQLLFPLSVDPATTAGSVVIAGSSGSNTLCPRQWHVGGGLGVGGVGGVGDFRVFVIRR